MRYLVEAAWHGQRYQRAVPRPVKDGPGYEGPGAPGNSPVAFERAMSAARDAARQGGETFDRDAAGRAWFRGRRHPDKRPDEIDFSDLARGEP